MNGLINYPFLAIMFFSIILEILAQNFDYTLEPWDINSIEILREKRAVHSNNVQGLQPSGYIRHFSNASSIAKARSCPTQTFNRCSNSCDGNGNSDAQGNVGSEPEASLPCGKHAAQCPDGCGRCKSNYPLPECYTNDSGYMCCNRALEQAMHQAYNDLKQSQCGDWNSNNIQSLSNAVQKKAEGCCGGTKFEVVTGIADFAAKIQFHGNNVCKIKRDCRVILAFATPQPPQPNQALPTPLPWAPPQYPTAPPLPQAQGYATGPQYSQPLYSANGGQMQNFNSYAQPPHKNYRWRI